VRVPESHSEGQSQVPRIATEKQKAAARRNGARSHGPKTLAGKLRIAARSFRHGRYARLNVMPEDAESFRAFRDSLASAIQPAGDVEAALAAAIAAAEWRLIQLFSLDRSVVAGSPSLSRPAELRYLGALECRLITRRARLLLRLENQTKKTKHTQKTREPIQNELVAGNIGPINEPETNPRCD